VKLRVEDVSVRFGETAALDRASLDVAEGEVVALLGPSGSGKSTLLRVVAGLESPDSGRVLVDGADVTRVPAHRRGVGLVFQDHALFDHKDVAGNVVFGLRMQGVDGAVSASRVRELLDLVGLPGYGRRAIGTLSGGEQQRVALARALAPEPEVLLLDEPLGSLDRRLRDRLLADLAGLFERLRVTAVYVTHDQGEAFALGDRVAVLREGRIVQVATPDELWARPADEDVARFLGLANVRDGRLVRPEAVRVRPARGAGEGVVSESRRDGPVRTLTVELDDGTALEAATTALVAPAIGERVDVEIDPAGIVELVSGDG
jgi:thiamine transport system ATP-binding protein